MSLLQLKNASLEFGHPPLLDGIELVIQAKERLCVVGRNGSGKSTLLKVIAAEVPLDDGQRLLSPETRIARLEQDPPLTEQQSIFSYVASGLTGVGELLSAYFAQTKLVETDFSEAALNKLEKLQSELEHKNAWQLEQRVETVLTQMGLDGTQQLASLSGGWRRKAALAKALAAQPDILLLDEPTNHLDINMIAWLEQTVQDYQGAVVFISHDRSFIRNIATRIVDLDRGKLTSYPGSYQAYLDQKAQDLAVEAQHNQAFDKKLGQEESWIRQGIKARRTRNEGRVRALKALREQHAQRRNLQGRASATLNQGASSGKLVFETAELTYQIEGRLIVSDLSFSLLRGDKIALIGPNGCGKSTLIKLLLEKLQPDAGSIKIGVNLEIAYFDQHRVNLDAEKKVIDVVADGKREVELNGRTKHVISYLQDYLFTPERINQPVHALSGGEKNRLLLAKLLAKPSNLLILDEPTNDLDIETLELLEDVLSQYQGTVILVSHDREFVDNVVTSSLFFEGEGVIKEFVGGYAEIKHWYQQQKTLQGDAELKSKAQKIRSSTQSSKKLSYKLKLELEALPNKIDELDNAISDLQAEVNQADFFTQDPAKSNKKLAELAELEEQLSSAYERWEELDSLQS